MEAPASRFHPVLQRFQKSMCLVQLSKAGKYASEKESCSKYIRILQLCNKYITIEQPCSRGFNVANNQCI